MQPTQSAAQVCLFVFFAENDLSRPTVSVSKQNISQFFAGRDLSARLHFRSPFFLLGDRFLHALFPFPVKNGHFLVSLQRASLSEFLDGIWNREEKKKQKN